MKCIALLAFIVAVSADPEPFYGQGLGYARFGAVGVPQMGYARTFVPQNYRSRVVASTPIISEGRTIVRPASVIAPVAVTARAPLAAPAVSPYVSTSAVRPTPSAPSTSQFHKQDELGNFEYGYQNINSAKHEAGNAHVGVSGAYSYRDAHGLERTISYVADGHGFRLTPTHLRHKRQATIVPSAPATRRALRMNIQLPNAMMYRVYH
jgi:hypothetical protein